MSSHAHPDGGATPRSLAEALRAGGDDALAALLRARPDLLSPVPNDLTQLATRAGTRASVVRALGRLDRFALQTAEALAVAPEPTPYATLRTLLTGDSAPFPATAGPSSAGGTGEEPEDGPDAAAVDAALPRALATLREQALVWGPDDALRLIRTAHELLAPSPQRPSPTGLGPTVAEATAGMSPGRIQEIVTTAGLPSTHDSVSAVTALALLFSDPERLPALLADAPPAALDVLSRLVWGPPYGQVTAEPAAHLRWLLDRGLLLPTAPGTVTLPREAALRLRGGRAHRVLYPLPPRVAPAAQRVPYDRRTVDAAAAGQALTALDTVEQLLKDWGETGPAVLRAGGLSVRDLKRTALALDVSEPVAAFWVELAYAAGLLASDGGTPETVGDPGEDGPGDPGGPGDPDTAGTRRDGERYAPTPAYDAWRELPPAERWTALASAWLAGTRTAGLVGERDGRDRTLSALGPGLDRSAAPEVRRRVLTLLAGLPEGTAPDPDSLLARLHWERPVPGTAPVPSAQRGGPPAQAARPRPAGRARRPAAAPPSAEAGSDRADLRSRLAEWTLSEAELLGVTGRGALSSHGRALLGVTDTERRADGTEVPGQRRDGTSHGGRDGRDGSGGTGVGAPGVDSSGPGALVPTPAERSAHAARAADVLAPLLPEPLDHVLLQTDLTAVAPGPLRRPLADMLDLLADVESKGGATVYRFTPASVRRALDAGRSADELHTFLAAHTRTPVPQPLSYLIDDVARRHGLLKVGAASAYVRCDDDTVLGEVLADKRSAALGLRRLAPTVLAARTDPGTLLDGLRTMGFAPAAESSDGDLVITRARSRRTPPRAAPEPVPEGPPVPDDALVAAAVRAIRAGDAAATAPRRPATDRPAPGATGRGGRTPPPGEPPRTTSADTLATVQAAVLTGERLWMGYVDAEGTATQRVIAPIRVEGGLVTVFDHTAEEVRTYPLHRITGVAELANE
mgnify:CR=1 FL=1